MYKRQPITRGSSGGALINSNGELIGITTAIATADVGAEGLGFAVPVNLALGIADDLLNEGSILHAFLGILGAQHFDTAEDGARVFSGVIIQELYGPGNEVFAIGKAGATAGDVIKKINGVNVKKFGNQTDYIIKFQNTDVKNPDFVNEIKTTKQAAVNVIIAVLD